MKKTVMVLAILFFGGQIAAQLKETLEHKRSFLGFNIGCNYSNVFVLGENIGQIHNGAGFRLGLLASEEINERLTLSPKAELSFNDGTIVYSSSNLQTTYEIYPINVDMMLHVNHKLSGNKFGAYILAGPNIRLPIKSRSLNFNNINLSSYGNNPDIAIDIGFGYEKLKKYYCFAPELRYSIGLLNVNKDPALDHVYFHNVTLVFNFKS
jgi:hypothetical protein